MIKIFGVSGSPRKGSTDYIVNEVLKYLEEKYNVQTHYFSARGKHLNCRLFTYMFNLYM